MKELVRNPSETDSIKSQISSKTSSGKKDSTKRRHQRHHQRQPGEQLFPIQMATGLSNIKHLFLPIFIFIYKNIRITINNRTLNLKPPKNQNRRAALGWPAIKSLGWGGLELVCGRPTLALGSALVHQTKQQRTTKIKQIKHKQKAKRAAGIEGQVATMLKSHTRQTV